MDALWLVAMESAQKDCGRRVAATEEIDAKWPSFDGSADCDRSSGQRLSPKLENSITSSGNRTCSPTSRLPVPYAKPALCGSRAGILEAVRRPSRTACYTVALLVRVANLDWSREARGVERRPAG
jgi:hypothetical protein